MKVLFLDIDGVLNSVRSCTALGGFPHDFSDDHMRMFDMVAIGLIRRLCRIAGLSVVLSSTWRVQYGPKEVSARLDLPVIDRTPVHSKGGRGLEIAAWLNAHPEVDAYAIVDDDGDMMPQQKGRFVQTSHDDGLTLLDYQRLLALFGKDELAR